MFSTDPAHVLDRALSCLPACLPALRETQLEGWMDEESKPPTVSGPAAPSSISPPGSPHTSGGRIAPKSSLDAGSPARDDDGASWGLPDVVLAVYLLNPVMAGQCAALSGDVLGRVLPLAALAAAGSGRPGVTAAALAAAACLWRFHAAPLILPAALMLAGATSRRAGGGGAAEARRNASEGRQDVRNGEACAVAPAAADGDSSSGTPASEAPYDPRYFELDGKALLRLSAGFLVWCAAILWGCWAATSGSWSFLGAAAKGQLLCENLTPNIGLYWYFFAELFPRFRGFFRVLFLSQPYVYVLPATLRLGMFPEALVRGGAGVVSSFGVVGFGVWSLLSPLVYISPPNNQTAF